MERRAGWFFCFLFWSALGHAGFAVDLPGGDRLEVRAWGEDQRGPLIIWLLNQYAETTRADPLAEELARRGATVWRVDLLESLMKERTAQAIRDLDGAPVAALLRAAEKQRRPVLLAACDRMAAPALKGLRAWQETARDSKAVAGAVLFFPNLYKGTPVAGEEPELLDIVDASNMPVMIMQPQLGANRGRLQRLLERLHRAGSAAHVRLVPQVRDYYLLQSEKPQSESLEAMAGPVPRAVEQAIRDTPNHLFTAARLLTAARHPSRPLPYRESAAPAAAPAYGLIPRPAQTAPALRLADAQGRQRSLTPGPVTLVNFWATWCPPCVHEIPSMNRLAAGYKGEDFAIVSVNFKEDPEHVQAFQKRVQVDFPVLLDRDGAASARWKVFAFPSSFLLDRQGRVRYSVNTAIEWDSPEVKAVIDRLQADTGNPLPPKR